MALNVVGGNKPERRLCVCVGGSKGRKKIVPAFHRILCMSIRSGVFELRIQGSRQNLVLVSFRQEGKELCITSNKLGKATTRSECLGNPLGTRNGQPGVVWLSITARRLRRARSGFRK
jgi:hypothetical protein